MSTSDAKFGETAEVGVLQHLADVTGAPFFCELCDSPLEDEHVIICSLHVYVCVYIIIYMYIYMYICNIYIYILYAYICTWCTLHTHVTVSFLGQMCIYNPAERFQCLGFISYRPSTGIKKWFHCKWGTWLFHEVQLEGVPSNKRRTHRPISDMV